MCPKLIDVPYLGGAWGGTQAANACVKNSLHRKTFRETNIV
jgi:hypothetical protein